MVILTTAPGLQFYTGNFLGVGGPTMGKQGKPYGHYGGLCLETEGFPDAIHQQTDSMGGGGSFPSMVLRPGEMYRHTTLYRFSSDQ